MRTYRYVIESKIINDDDGGSAFNIEGNINCKATSVIYCVSISYGPVIFCRNTCGCIFQKY